MNVRPDDKIKCPSLNASVFFKTAKEFFKESIFFIFMSNNFKFNSFCFNSLIKFVKFFKSFIIN